MTPELAAIVVALLGAVGFITWDRGCHCTHCAFHTNERRMAALRQAELQHDLDHKGFGFKPNDKDILPCRDDSCPRNPQDMRRGTLDE
jgi:hypothetical protein